MIVIFFCSEKNKIKRDTFLCTGKKLNVVCFDTWGHKSSDRAEHVWAESDPEAEEIETARPQRLQECFGVIKCFHCCALCVVVPEENIATMKHGAVVVKGEMKSALLDGDTQNYDLDHGFSRHPIEEEGRATGIQVRLGQPAIINHLRLLLWDKDSR